MSSSALDADRRMGLPGLKDLGSRHFSLYLAFVRNAFLNMLAYRLRYYTGIVTYLLFVAVHFFIWQAVFAGHDVGAVIRGFTLSEMVTYVSVGWIARSLYFSSIDMEINEMVKTGQVSIFLLRPVHFHTIMFCQAAGESLFRLVFFTLPIGAVIVTIFPVMLPSSTLDALFFLISLLFSFLVLTELNFIVGLLAFTFKSIEGIVRAKYFVVQLFSGLLLPLSFFPSRLEQVLDFLPFKIIASVPLRFYLGKIDSAEVPSVFLNQVLWFAVLFVIGQLMWRQAMNKLTLQGG